MFSFCTPLYRYTHALAHCSACMACTLMFRRTRSILKLLTTFGEETEVMDALRVGTLGARSAALVSVMFRSLYGEESAELAVADPEAWGLDKVCGSLRSLCLYRCTHPKSISWRDTLLF